MQSLRWYLNRLGRMSPAEIGYRLSIAKRSTVARLGLSKARVPAPSFSGETHRFVQAAPGLSDAAYTRAADKIIAGEHSIFNLKSCQIANPPDWNTDPLTGRRAPLVNAYVLDYRDQRIVGNIKYLWEPNRHLHLPTLAQAYALTGDVRYATEIRRHLESWIEQCPYLRGPNWTSALEFGIRLINWSVAWQLLGGERSAIFSGESGRAFLDAWLRSVYLHAQAVVQNLSRFSSANNHLVGEAAGVWVASVTWPYWPRLQSWGEKCRRVLAEEILAQNAADGGNREQAFSYQQFVFDFFLISGLAARSCGADFDPPYWQRLERMIEYLASMMDVGGNVPMIGDADDGFVVRLSQEEDFSPYRSLIATGALLFERSDLARKAGRIDHKTCWLIGEEAQPRFERLLGIGPVLFKPRRDHPDSGYFLLGDRFETEDEIRLLVDAGPLGYLSLAAHGHADSLAVVLNAGGMDILVDPGTYAYHTEPEWRRYFRSTRAHNTVFVDDEDQSVQSGNFMWSRHANSRYLEFSVTDSMQRFVGQHDGYECLSDPVTHRREIVFDTATRQIEIRDMIQCTGSHNVARHWHISEQLVPVVRGDACVVVAGQFTVVIEPGEPIGLAKVYRGGTHREGGWISRSFGNKEPCTTLRWENAIHGNTMLVTRIRCTPSAA